MTDKGKEYAPREGDLRPVTDMLPPCNQRVTPPSPNGYPKEKKEIKELKEQTTEPVCLSEKFGEEKNLRLKLQQIGINKNQAKALLRKFPEERITRQLEYLKELEQGGREIKNPAGWLISAVERNYQPTVAQQKAAQATREAQEEKKRRRAGQLLEQARELEMEGRIEDAKIKAQESLEVRDSKEIRDMAAKLDKKIVREEAIAKARAAISKERWDSLVAEELEKQNVLLRKLGLPDGSKLAHINAVTQAHEKLLSGIF